MEDPAPTLRQRAEEHNQKILEIVASPQPLASQLTELILSYQDLFPGMLGSVMLLDEPKHSLRHAAAPGLPLAFCQSLDGLSIGQRSGSCGTAAYTLKTTITTDIPIDPLWTDLKDLALEHGLKACWALPILNLNGKILGTFAFYFKTPRSPLAEELAIMQRGAQLTSLAIGHHLALAGLKESEEQYRGLIELSPDIIAVAQLGKIVFINQAGVKFIGFDHAHEIIGRSMLEFFHPDSHQEVFSRMRQLDEGAIISPMELKFLDKDGKSILAESRAMLFPWKGTVAKLAIIRDISERKRTEAALIHSEERYRTLATVSPVGLYRTDLEGKNTFVNEHLCTMLGYTHADLIGKTGAGSIHPKDLNWVRSSWQATMATNKQFKAEFRLLKPNGSIIWVMGNSQAEVGEQGEIVGYVGTLTEITERKQAEILLGLQKRSLALGMSGAPLNLVLNDLAHYVANESNQAFTGILKLETPAFLKWTAAGNLPLAFLQTVPGYTINSPKTDMMAKPFHSKEIHIHPDLSLGDTGQSERQAALSHGFLASASQPILGPNQQVLGIIASFYKQTGSPHSFDCKLLETASGLASLAIERDHQERMGKVNLALAEENHRIVEASRMKSEFMAVMSHELRTPLNAVIGFSQLLLDQKLGHLNPKQFEYLGDILDGGMHLLRLITDMLDLAKIEAGKMQLHVESIAVNQTIREVCDNLLSLALAKEINLRIATESTVESVVVDSHKFRQVIYNLVSNAIKFSPKGGDVVISTGATSDGGLRLSVIDRGIGIRKEDLGKLFQQFQQLDSGTKRQFSGTGLGLLITKRLVELHKGEVGVESEFGKGSTFHATFPKPSEANLA